MSRRRKHMTNELRAEMQVRMDRDGLAYKQAYQQVIMKNSPHYQRVNREGVRESQAKSGNYAPPPKEADCPPRPEDGRCQMPGCRKFVGVKKLHLDHDHKTGRFRGWLCTPCNRGLGAFGDGREGLENALRYVS